MSGALLPGLALLLGMFGLVGLFGVYRAIRSARAERQAAGLAPPPGRSLRERMRDYVGPVEGVTLPLNPPLRVLVEFWFALLGFPGLGWLLSRRMLPGIVLLSVVPSLVWAVIPVILVRTGILDRGVFSLVVYLPFVAVASEGTLAIAEASGGPKEQRA